ncbi:MAG: hypothetical protein IJH84_21975, partial [Saccharopolyspora sp.]|uniref:hypothetical protein n=1 Tax=Saccharopolyspora sp. TaxID=33915 RepID=UPI0025E2D7F3
DSERSPDRNGDGDTGRDGDRQDNSGDRQETSDKPETPMSADEIREALPEYIRDGQSLGPLTPSGATRRPELSGENTRDLPFTGPDVVASLNKLLPGKAGKWEDVHLAQKQIDNEPQSLVGEGDTFIVRKGGEYYELGVKATPLWDRVRPMKTVLDADMRARTIPVNNISDFTLADRIDVSRDGTFSPQLAYTAIPGLYVYVNPTVPFTYSESATSKHTAKFGASNRFDLKNLQDVEVPMRFDFTLRGKHGERVIPSGVLPDVDPATQRFRPFTITDVGNVALRVPVGLDSGRWLGNLLAAEYARGDSYASPLDAGRLENLGAAGVHRLGQLGDAGRRAIRDSDVIGYTIHTEPLRGSFFEQVKARLDRKYSQETDVGAHGRPVLANFLHGSNIAALLPKMAVFDGAHPQDGWTRSDDEIYRGRGLSKFRTQPGTRVEMRAVAKWIKLAGEQPDLRNRNAGISNSGRAETRSAGRSDGVNVVAGPGGEVLGHRAMAGPNVGFSRGANHAQEVSGSTEVANTLEKTGDTVGQQLAFEIQVRELGGRPFTLDGLFVADMLGDLPSGREAGLFDGTPLAARHQPGEFRSGADRTHFLPESVENGHAFVGDFAEFPVGRELYDRLADLLREVPLRGKRLDSNMFVGRFDDPDFAKGLSARISEALKREQDLAGVLADEQVFQQVAPLLLGEGLYLPVYAKEFAHDYVSMIRLSMDFDNVRDGDPL